jgi:NitT/TauT family transport system permease protein
MSFTRVRQALSRRTEIVVGVITVASLIIAYFTFAVNHHAANPRDQMVPTFGMMVSAAKSAVTPDEFSGVIPLLADVKSSLTLIAVGFSSAVLVSLFIGLHIGAWPWLNAVVDPVFKIFSFVPTIALLFIILATLGTDAPAKMFLIFFATVVPLTRSLKLHVDAVPDKPIWKAETLGASNFEVIWIVLRKSTEPKFLDDVRLQLGNAWIYLIVAELLASKDGIGYRINVASRNMNMSMICVYLLVITLLAFLMDRGLWLLNRLRNRWAF